MNSNPEKDKRLTCDLAKTADWVAWWSQIGALQKAPASETLKDPDEKHVSINNKGMLWNQMVHASERGNCGEAISTGALAKHAPEREERSGGLTNVFALDFLILDGAGQIEVVGGRGAIGGGIGFDEGGAHGGGRAGGRDETRRRRWINPKPRGGERRALRRRESEREDSNNARTTRRRQQCCCQRGRDDGAAALEKPTRNRGKATALGTAGGSARLERSSERHHQSTETAASTLTTILW